MWRPGNWENPYAKVDDLGMYVIPVGENNITNKRTAYEAGADALLQSLRKETGLEVDISAGIRVFPGGKPQLLVRGKDTPTSKGKLVFIPDEEGNDDSPTTDPQPEV